MYSYILSNIQAIYSYNIMVNNRNNGLTYILRSSSVDQIGARKCEQGRGPPFVRYELIIPIIPPRYAPPSIIKRVTRL